MEHPIIHMKWKRPDSVEFPRVWHRFQSRDLNSDKLVEYRIEDLQESRADEAFNHMRDNYLADEPISHAFEGDKDIEFVEEYIYGWRSALVQKMPLVCYREGSEDIVGLNWNFVTNKADGFVQNFTANIKSHANKVVFGIAGMLYEKFDPFAHYGVEEYMTSFGLSVDKKYRGRGIGDHFLDTRKKICREFGIKLTHTIFSSDYSSQNAENVGFKTDAYISYDEARKLRPDFRLPNVKSKGMSVKTLLI